MSYLQDATEWLRADEELFITLFIFWDKQQMQCNWGRNVERLDDAGSMS